MANANPARIGSSAKVVIEHKVCDVCKNSPCEKWEECLYEITISNGQTIKKRR